MSNFLLDSDFLKQIDLNRNKIIYARLTALTNHNAPVEVIEGRITGGSINCDGNSAIRRTCNISLVGQDLKITEFHWALKSRFKVEIGVHNNISDEYENIIWFKQGIYIINSFSKSHSASGISVNISGQDKMCLLNGSLGGALPFQVDFGTYEEEVNGNYVKKKILIKDIIQEALIVYGKEPQGNIIINDLDNVSGWELWNYRGTTPLYLYYLVKRNSDGLIQNLKLYNISLDNTKKMKRKSNGKTYLLTQLPSDAFYSRNNIIGKTYTGWVFESAVKNDGKEYMIMKVEYGEDAGYHKTDLVFAGDLILQTGETITNLLDKIAKQLGNFEYFYDLDGRFVFQKKRAFLSNIFSPIADDNPYVLPVSQSPDYSYKFNDATLINSYSNSIDISKIKNEFSIWGKRKGLSGSEIDVHARFAINKKPTEYTSLSTNKTFRTSGEGKVDWREIIYQMAIDYNKYSRNSDFTQKLINKNPQYYMGTTGYEQYYIDILGFWREIYDGTRFIVTNPSNLKFWLDFIEPNGEIGAFSTNTLGERLKTDNDSSIKAMWYEEIPEIEFLLANELDDYSNSYQGIRLPNNYEKYFSSSSRGISVFERADELLNEHVLSAPSITLNCLPIYYLQPNTKIYVKDEKSEIEGDFILSSFSMPLNYNGTMSITARKIIKDFVM